MEESTQIKLFTEASAIMESFLSSDDAAAYSGFTGDFRFSDPKGLFRNDVHFFRSFLIHLDSSQAYQFKWKMRRYVRNDIEFALYFSKKDSQVQRKDPNITIMAWLYLPSEGKATRLSLDYDVAQVIDELSLGKLDSLRNRIKQKLGKYSITF